MINETKKAGGRVIAVGTTSCRVLETIADENGLSDPPQAENLALRDFLYIINKFNR